MKSCETGRWSSIPLCVLLVGCIEIVEPTPPVIDAGAGGGSCPGTCNCAPETMTGRAYRFTKLRVQEPPQMAETLDAQWESEMANYLLNVVFVVNGAERTPDTTSNFSRINITAGSAWRFPALPYVVTDGFAVEQYCLTDDSLNFVTDATPKGEAQCTFKNEITVSLPFHLGPLSNPLMCAPQLTPKNATPIRELDFEFGFNEDCTAITNGYLTGCIPQEAANRICVCVSASLCGRDNMALDTPFPTEFTETRQLSQYCRTTCGQGGELNWGNFRAMLDLNSGDTDPSHPWPMMPTSCELPDGTSGYKLSARFEAEEVTDKLVASGTGNCSGQ